MIIHIYLSVSAPPQALTRNPTFTKAPSLDLGSYYHWVVGIGHNAAILGHYNNKTICKYTIDSHHIEEIYAKPLPDGFQQHCRKYLLPDGCIVLRDINGNDPTKIYTANLVHMKTYSGEYGWLIGTLGSDMIAYVKNTASSHGYEVHIYSADNNHQRVLRLKPSEDRKWSWCLSVCMHPHTGYMAVVCNRPHTVDIYNKQGGCSISYCLF